MDLSKLKNKMVFFREEIFWILMDVRLYGVLGKEIVSLRYIVEFLVKYVFWLFIFFLSYK